MAVKKPVVKATPTPVAPTPAATPKATPKPTVAATPTAKATQKPTVTSPATSNAWQTGTFPGATPAPTKSSAAVPAPTLPGAGGTGEQKLPAGINPYFVPAKDTTLYDVTQTSKQDVAAKTNAIMQSLSGRNATPAEIEAIGAALLAAERANPTIVKQTTNREGLDSANPGLATSLTGGTTSSGVNADSFIENLISQTGEAKNFKVATGYFQGMLDANTKFSGAYNG
jgi:hypothetical protein